MIVARVVRVTVAALRACTAAKAAVRAASGVASASIWPSLHARSSPAVAAMLRISAFICARVRVGVCGVSAIVVSASI